MAVGAPSEVERRLAGELDRQLALLLERGYAEASGLGERGLADEVDALRPLVDGTMVGGSQIPFVLCVSRALVPPARAVAAIERRRRPALSSLGPDELESFTPIPSLALPNARVYLLVNVDTGADLRDVTPDDALSLLGARGRSPLTLEEGIAVATHFPEAVAKGAGFSLLGSRCGDRRVTALWIGGGRPKLGWCWAGNPHTWLGSASCSDRRAAAA